MSLERRRTAAAGLVVLTCAALYVGSLDAPFLWDDGHAIQDNPYVQSPWPFAEAWRAPDQSTLAGRPVAAISFALNHAAFGMDVRAFRAVNVGIHAACALLILALGRRVVRPAVALAIALLWAVHPLCSETVIYVVQRTEGLMAFFYLLTIYAATRAGDALAPRWFVCAVVACVAGMASKESMVTAPVAVVLWDVSFGGRRAREVAARRWPLWCALAASWIVLAYLMAGGPRSETVGFSIGTPVLDYAKHQALVVLDYLRHVVWPGRLVFDYGYPAAIERGPALAAIAAVTLLAAGACMLWWRRPRLGFLALAPFLVLAPTSSIVPIVTEVGAERRMYLPLAAIVALAVVASDALLARRRARFAIFVIVFAALGLRTVARTQDYATAESIWRTAVAATPRNARAHENLGHALQLQGRLPEAIESYERSIELMPDNFMVQYNVASALVEAGREDEGLARYRRAIELNPGHVDSQLNLGSLLANRERLPEAIDRFREASKLQPTNVQAWFNLGRALRLSGRSPEAAHALRAAARLDPDDAVTQAELAWLLATSPDRHVRDPAAAVELARRALAADEDDPLRLDTLAAAEAAAGRFDVAVALARRARELAVTESLASEIDRRLAFYGAGRPWIERAVDGDASGC